MRRLAWYGTETAGRVHELVHDEVGVRFGTIVKAWKAILERDGFEQRLFTKRESLKRGSRSMGLCGLQRSRWR